jgi:hypothetical protein
MYPGSFIWNRISDEWLQSKTASSLFALSSVFIAAMTVVCNYDDRIPTTGFLVNLLLGVGGVLGVSSLFFLWGGMWRYWLRCDQSARILRRFTFVLLIVGICFGAIFYYLIVYLPGVRKHIRSSVAREIV